MRPVAGPSRSSDIAGRLASDGPLVPRRQVKAGARLTGDGGWRLESNTNYTSGEACMPASSKTGTGCWNCGMQSRREPAAFRESGAVVQLSNPPPARSHTSQALAAFTHLSTTSGGDAAERRQPTNSSLPSFNNFWNTYRRTSRRWHSARRPARKHFLGSGSDARQARKR